MNRSDMILTCLLDLARLPSFDSTIHDLASACLRKCRAGLQARQVIELYLMLWSKEAPRQSMQDCCLLDASLKSKKAGREGTNDMKAGSKSYGP